MRTYEQDEADPREVPLAEPDLPAPADSPEVRHRVCLEQARRSGWLIDAP